MFHKIAILCVFLSFFCFQETIASAQNGDKEKLTLSLMKKSGLNQQILHVPDVLNAAVASNFRRALQAKSSEVSDITKKINTIISVSFKPEIIKGVISTHMEAELDINEIKAVLAWLNSPLGKKITRLEEEAATPEAYKAMGAALPALRRQFDYKKRIELMKELDGYMSATDSILERELNMQIVSLTAMSSAFPTMSLPSSDVLKENFKSYRKTMRKGIEAEILMNYLYTYRELNVSEILKYINFIKTDYGERYHRVVHDGINKAYLFCGKQFGENVGKMLIKDSVQHIKKPDIQNYPQRK